jgi:hypothetical protein
LYFLNEEERKQEGENGLKRYVTGGTKMCPGDRDSVIERGRERVRD